MVLLIAFGSFLAMGLPVVTALLGLGSAFGAIALLSQVIDMPDFASELAAMIGLGVGIDYALFIVTRFRENRRDDESVRGATIGAMDTAGRAVLFAGTTVMLALLGQFVLGMSFLNGLAISSAVAVLLTMTAALTALPAMLGRLGKRIGGPRRAPAAPGFWARWAGLVRRHPWPAAIAGLAIMLVVATPLLSMRTGLSDAGNDPAGTTTRKAYDLLADGFGKGFNGPLEVVAQLPQRGDRAALGPIAATLRDTPDVASVSKPSVSPAGRTALYQVFPRSAPQAGATTDLVKSLRDRILPPVAHGTGATILVGGQTAAGIDFAHVLSNKLPLFIGVVVGVAALLLLVVFRSLVIPLPGSRDEPALHRRRARCDRGDLPARLAGRHLRRRAGADRGVAAGHAVRDRLRPLDGLRGVPRVAHPRGMAQARRPLGSGLARSRHDRTRDHRRGDDHDLRLPSLRARPGASVKMSGSSLAAAVFLDAFVIRCLLLPAVLELVGRRTWAFPAWLDRRLPRLATEPATDTPARVTHQA